MQGPQRWASDLSLDPCTGLAEAPGAMLILPSCRCRRLKTKLLQQ